MLSPTASTAEALKIPEATLETLLTSHDARTWSSRDGSRFRLYINDWAALIGLRIDRYNTGNISHATLNGDKISNSEAGRILAAGDKVWIENGEVHVTGSGRVEWVPNAIIDGIRAIAKGA